jgi:hypothetical protein
MRHGFTFLISLTLKIIELDHQYNSHNIIEVSLHPIQFGVWVPKRIIPIFFNKKKNIQRCQKLIFETFRSQLHDKQPGNDCF